jgi:outer membrane protein TolC
MRRLGRFAAALALAVSPAARAEPLDLVACVRVALARNADVQDAADSAASAVLGREVPMAEYNLKIVPAVSGGVQGGNNTDQRYNLDLGRRLLVTGTKIDLSGGTSVYSAVPQVSVPYLTQARITVTQPLWRGRTQLENTEKIDDADRRVASAKHGLSAARQDLMVGVIRGFYEVVRADELVGVAQSSLDRVAQLDQVARAKLAIGAVSKMDVFRTELHAARLKNALVEQQARRGTALDQLRELMGLAVDVPLEIDARLPERAAAPGAAARVGLGGLEPRPGERVEESLEEAEERREEIAEAREQVADAERKALLARYRIWPSIDLVGSYAKQGIGDDFTESTHLDRTEWLVGLSTTTPLDRTEERVAAAQAEIVLRGRERRYRIVRDQVTRQVRDAWRQLDRARAERTLAAEILEQSEKQAELARFRYDKGVTDNFDLVQAETDLAEARSGQVLAAIDELLAAAALRRATGTLGDAFGLSEERSDGDRR